MSETGQEPSADAQSSPRGMTGPFRWAIAIVAGLTLAVVLVIGMNMWSTTYMVNDDGDVLIDGEALESDASAAAPNGEAKPEPSRGGIPDPEVAYAVEKLTRLREDSANALRNLGLPVEIPEEQSDDTPSEELLGKYNADLYTIVKIGETDTIEAERLIPGLMNPDNTDDYAQLVNKVIGKITADSLADNRFRDVIDWSDNFYTGMIKNVEPNGEATRFITATLADTFANQFTFQRENGEWILQKQLPLEDPEAILNTREFNEAIPR